MEHTWVREKGEVKDNSKVFALSTWKNGTSISWFWRLKGRTTGLGWGKFLRSGYQLDFQVEKSWQLNI